MLLTLLSTHTSKIETISSAKYQYQQLINENWIGEINEKIICTFIFYNNSCLI